MSTLHPALQDPQCHDVSSQLDDTGEAGRDGSFCAQADKGLNYWQTLIKGAQVRKRGEPSMGGNREGVIREQRASARLSVMPIAGPDSGIQTVGDREGVQDRKCLIDKG